MKELLKTAYNNDIVYKFVDKIYEILGKIIHIKKKVRKPIIITGAPRSGTTWLAEIFCQGTGGIIYWEPLHLRNQKDLQKMNFTWRPVIKREENNTKYQRFFEEIINCRKWNRHLLSQIKIPDIFLNKYWVIKFVRANGVVQWLMKNFQISVPLVIIRHPCAVISSQIERRSKHKTSSEKYVLNLIKYKIPSHAIEFLKYYPDFNGIFDEIDSWEEYLAILWSMDNFHLFNKEKKEIIILPYEKLYLETKKTIYKLFEYYNLELNEKLLTEFQKPSSTVTDLTEVKKKNKNPLNKWKDIISEPKIIKIFEITKKFGLNFYSNKEEPDYKMINDFSLIDF